MYSHNFTHQISTHDRPSLRDLNVIPDVTKPSRDWQTWSRWRMAVNDRLCDSYMEKERTNQFGLEQLSRSIGTRYSDNNTIQMPSRNVSKVDPTLLMATFSRDAHSISRLGDGQFVYYGIPRLDVRVTPRRQWSVKRGRTYTLRNDRPSYEILYCNRN